MSGLEFPSANCSETVVGTAAEFLDVLGESFLVRRFCAIVEQTGRRMTAKQATTTASTAGRP